jgi:hypothetical protein
MSVGAIAIGVLASFSGSALADTWQPNVSYPAWQPNVNYSAGAIATYGTMPNNIGYQCRQTHTSQTGWEPPNVPALWDRPTPFNCLGWANQTNYKVGTIVVYNGLAYKCIQAHDSVSTWTPPATPALWAPVDASTCSTAAATSFNQAYNNPAHFSNLAVSASGGVTTASFLVQNVQVRAALTVTSPTNFSYAYSAFDSSASLWKSLGTSTPSKTTFDSTALAQFSLSKNTLVLAISEVLVTDSVLNKGIFDASPIKNCNKATTLLSGNIFSLAGTLMNDISARETARFVEDAGWNALGNRCTVEASCHIDLTCFIPGVPLNGTASCDASKGFSNQCLRQPGNRKVICREFDEKGNLIGESVVECRKE